MIFAAITLCVASQRVFIVVVYFVIDSVRKLLDTSSLVCVSMCVRVRKIYSLCIDPVSTNLSQFCGIPQSQHRRMP